MKNPDSPSTNPILDYYQNPLQERYSSKEMSHIFSTNFKIKTWRKLWLVLAEEQQKLGLPISNSQLDELRRNIGNLNLDVASQWEKKIKHEVMSHLKAYCEQCPEASKILHLGATSAFILDNTTLIQTKEALLIIKKYLCNIIAKLADFSLRNKNIPTLGYTHYQVAQPTTVGKRSCLWLQDILLDYHEIELRLSTLPFRSIKGTTGTQDSFLTLFHGNHEKVKLLEQNISKRMGFKHTIPISGQTYSRKIDCCNVGALNGIALSAHKFSNDIRLLQNLGEIEEPIEKHQIGSSAMPYKRNPIRSERITSLARFVSSQMHNVIGNTTGQWLERTLDDSANQRLCLPESFLATQTILTLYLNILSGLTIYPARIKNNLRAKLPFLIQEQILMLATQRGKNRQETHETLRQLSFQNLQEEFQSGIPSGESLLENIANNPNIPITQEELTKIAEHPNITGRSEQQVVEFINDNVLPILEQEKSTLSLPINSNLSV